MATHIAQQLYRQKKNQISLALLLYPSGLEFIAAFFGCLYANVIAVPMPIPKKARHADRLTHILQDPSLAFILTDTKTFPELQRLPLFQSLEKITWVITGENSAVTQNYLDIYYPKKQAIAFLQFTSGSTSAPKGVMVSHQNIIANESMIKEAFGHDERPFLWVGCLFFMIWD